MNRINKQITAPTVMVIDEDGNRLGTMTTKQAIEKAEADFKDLIEVSSSSSPPVCKIMEYTVSPTIIIDCSTNIVTGKQIGRAHV